MRYNGFHCTRVQVLRRSSRALSALTDLQTNLSYTDPAPPVPTQSPLALLLAAIALLLAGAYGVHMRRDQTTDTCRQAARVTARGKGVSAAPCPCETNISFQDGVWRRDAVSVAFSSCDLNPFKTRSRVGYRCVRVAAVPVSIRPIQRMT
jgi:hypothetical protein